MTSIVLVRCAQDRAKNKCFTDTLEGGDHSHL